MTDRGHLPTSTLAGQAWPNAFDDPIPSRYAIHSKFSRMRQPVAEGDDVVPAEELLAPYAVLAMENQPIHNHSLQ